MAHHEGVRKGDRNSKGSQGAMGKLGGSLSAVAACSSEIWGASAWGLSARKNVSKQGVAALRSGVSVRCWLA